KRASRYLAKIMNHSTAIIVLLACIVAMGSWWLTHRQSTATRSQSTASSASQIYTQGEQVGDFTLPNLAGKKTHLAKWHGKVVVLNFWATWCAPCRAEMPMLAQMQRKYGKDGLKIVGVAMSQPQTTMGFLNA